MAKAALAIGWFVLAIADEESCKVSMLQTGVSLGRRVEKNQIYNVHIPKSAGSSFALDAQDILRPLQLISQEGCLALHRSNVHLKGSITMLREPRAHVLSQYKMCRSQWVEEYRQATRQKGQHVLPHRFENWVEAWERIREEGWHGDFTPGAALESQNDIELKIRQARIEAWGQPPYSIENGTKLRMEDWPLLDGGGTVWHFSRAPFQCYSPINMQSHRLSCQKPLKYEPETDKEQLIENVNSLWFVGFAEAYQSSLCLLHWRFSQSLPSYCDCDSEQWHSFQGHIENQNSTYHGEVKLSQLGRKVLKQIDALTATDRFLYGFAWRRFLRECEEVHKHSGKRILCNTTSVSH